MDISCTLIIIETESLLHRIIIGFVEAGIYLLRSPVKVDVVCFVGPWNKSQACVFLPVL